MCFLINLLGIKTRRGCFVATTLVRSYSNKKRGIFSSVFENYYICEKHSAMVEIINAIRKYNYWDGNSFDLGYERAL
jgi:hypothetical protein